MGWMLMPYDRYADFSGRSCRTEYWMFSLFGAIVTIFGIILFIMIGFDDETGQVSFMGWFLGALGVMWLVGSIVPGLAVTFRRLHDAGFSGWFYLLSFIPYVGGLIMFVFMLLPGTPGPNQYGDESDMPY